MRIIVKAKPNSKKSLVRKDIQAQLPFIKDEEDKYTVFVTAPPIDGKANKAVIELLAEYFKVSKSKIELIKGETTKTKVFEIIK